MDNLTHTLFAATLARTPLGRAGRGTTAALVLASNAPDLDIVAAAGGNVSYLQWHRGPTHGPVGIVGLALLGAGLVWLGRRTLDRRSAQRSAPHVTAPFPMLVAVSTIAVVLHVLMDLPTSYGTRLLSPFDWRWFAFDWMPIVDVYLLALLVFGLIWGEISRRSRPTTAAIVLALMACNYGVRALAHHEVLARAPRLLGAGLPPPCDGRTAAPLMASWPRSVVATLPLQGGPCLVEVAAVPSMSSPFRWTVIARLSNAYELHAINLLDARAGRSAGAREPFGYRTVRYPDQWRAPTVAAAASRTGRVFLGFSRFPAARLFVDPTGAATVRWTDMRFAGATLFSGRRPADLFTVLVRVGADGGIRQEQLGVR